MAGGDCIGTGCSNISYTGNTLIFNVTSLSSYSGNFTFFNFAPTFSNASNTSPNFRRYQNFTANISISDDRELDYYIFSTNASGAWTNVTVDVSGTQYNASHQANITSSKNSLVCWYFKNFENSTRYCFTVRNTLPRFKTSLTAQSVQVGRSLSYQIECEDDDASDTITYYDNTTLFDIGSATGLISHTPAAADIGTYTANITCGDGDDNVSETFAYTISAAAAEAAAAVAAGGGGGGSRYECKSNADCPKDKYCVKNICLKIFDLKILYLDSPIPPGEYLDFTYFVKGMADISGDVTFDFKVEQDTQIVSSGSDVIFIGSFEEKTEMTQLTLPSDLTEGTYTFTVTLRFEEYEISSSRTFEVRKETPFLPSVTILDLPVIEPNYQWNYSFIIGVNKDEPVSAVVERKISTAERTIWSKQESLVLNRSQIINDVIPGLEEGNYLLEVRAQIENHTATASQTLMIGTPSEEPSEKPKAGKAKALAGQSIFARLFLTTYDFTTIWVGGVMALFMILLLTSLIRKKKAKKLLFTPPPSLDGLEQWVREMQAMRTPTPEIIKIALEQTKWTEEDLRTVLARIDATQQLQAHYGEYLTEKMLNDLRAYITACTKKDIYKGEVITTLLHQGWDRQAIEPYVVAYYR
ncbi:hypothetical protein J4420_00605 [Candidatus Woesearchaeota archaeon]|nr:hypothetical protein [Candidatus Woesearchaeota archaeon]